jgi:hypothetical protein
MVPWLSLKHSQFQWFRFRFHPLLLHDPGSGSFFFGTAGLYCNINNALEKSERHVCLLECLSTQEFKFEKSNIIISQNESKLFFCINMLQFNLRKRSVGIIKSYMNDIDIN